jgi:hypothetical protein
MMTDTCRIVQSGSAPIFNPTTGDYTPSDGTTVYDGPCRVKRETTPERQVEAGDAPVLLRRYVVSVPLSVVGVKHGMPVAITASGDPDLVNVALVVRDVGRGTTVTARRLICQEQT